MRKILSYVLTLFMVIFSTFPCAAYAAQGDSSYEEIILSDIIDTDTTISDDASLLEENILSGTIDVDTEISTDTILEDGLILHQPLTIQGSDDPDHPTLITVNGTVTIDCIDTADIVTGIQIYGNVKIVSEKETNSVIASGNANKGTRRFFSAKNSATLSISNITIDGSVNNQTAVVVFSGGDNATVTLQENTAVEKVIGTQIYSSNYASSIFEIKDNTCIKNNTLSYVCSSNGSFKMSGGRISDNTLKYTPIHCRSTFSNVTITGGIISDNTITATTNTSAGLTIQVPDVTLDLQGGVLGSNNTSGLPVINFNHDSHNPSDYLELPGKTQINGTVQFKSTPDKVYYYILDEESSSNRLSEFPPGTENLHKIDLNDVSGGTISTSPISLAPSGTPVTVVPTVANDTWKLYSVSYSDASGSHIIEADETGTYSFMMPDEDVTVSAVFGQGDPHPITITSSENGSVTAVNAGESGVPQNTPVTLKVDPAPAYRLAAGSLKAVYTDSEDAEQSLELTENNDGTYSFTMPDADVTISAEFELLPVHRITFGDFGGGTVSVQAGGSAEPSDSTYYTDVVTLTPSADAWYVLTALKVTSGESEAEVALTKNSDGTYSFIMPDADVKITATFSKIASAGDGTQESPYEISSLEELEAFRDAVNAGISFKGQYLKLISDISLPGSDNATNWTPIGYYKNATVLSPAVNRPFSGTFDGGDHVISNLFIRNDAATSSGYRSQQGLFGRTDGAEIRNLTVIGDMEGYANCGSIVGSAVDTEISGCTNGVFISCLSNDIGGIAGELSGDSSILNCSNTAAISGKGIVGGIAGNVSGNITISGCTNCGRISHQSPGGGIVGIVSGGESTLIENCANTGNVGGTARSGGIVGTVASSLTVKNTYNTGDISAGRSQNGAPMYAGGIAAYVQSPLSLLSCYSVGNLSITVSGAEDYTGVNAEGQLVGYVDPSVNDPSVSNSYYVNDCPQAGVKYSIKGIEQEQEVTITDLGVKVSEDALKTLSVPVDLGDAFAADSASVNGGWPILSYQNDINYYTIKVTGTGSAGEGLTAYIGDLYGTLIPAEGIKYPSGSALTITLSLANTAHKIVDVSSGDYTFASPQENLYQLGFSFVVAPYMADENGVIQITADTQALQAGEKPSGGVIVDKESTVPSSRVWDGVSVDLSWFNPDKYDATDSYTIKTPAQLMGLAALVNGLVNEDCELYLWSGHGLSTIEGSTNKVSAAVWNSSTFVLEDTGSMSGGQGLNQATDDYHYGMYDFKDKTIILANDIDMGGDYSSGSWSGPNYMPIGGQYLMTDEDTSTKISASFSGTFDGGGHYVYNIYCDRHCSSNYGDGSSVGLIGRLGCHDNDVKNHSDWIPDNPGVYDVAVTGYIYANRSVGGIVGKIGRTNDGATISGCANYATVYGTDAKGTGGIAGASWNSGTIENCYNMGQVTNTHSAYGGIAGSNEIEIVNCYNAGIVDGAGTSAAIATHGGGSYTSCYWLTGSANVGIYSRDFDGVKEMTAEQMQAADFALLSDSGSKFIQDTQNNNQGYPIFSWQRGRTISNPDSSGSGGTVITGDISITAGTNGKVTVDKPEAKAGETVTLTVTPNTGYTVDQLSVTDKNGKEITVKDNGDGTYSFTKPDGAVKVNVTFKSVQPVNPDISKFTDVSSDNWFYDAVSYVVEKGLFNGVSETEFAPDTTMTRAMFVTVLGRLEGIDISKYTSSSFSDVETGKWYSAYIQWASENDIVNGIGGGKFNPDGEVTREQMAAIKYRYAQFKNIDVANSDSTAFESFADNASVSAYAKDAMIWATANGIINGTGSGLEPKNDATRAQVAQIIKNYAEKIIKA